MTQTFKADERDKLLETFNSNPGGAFISILGYESIGGEGERADYQLQSGVNYDKVKKMSIDKLQAMIAGLVPSVHVKCNTWKDDVTGEMTNRKKEGRTLITFEQTYKWDSLEFQAAARELLDQLQNPKKVDSPFTKEAKGLYSIEGQVLYIRECLVMNKKVHTHGQRPVSATTPEMALKNEIKDQLPISNYRQFKLDGRFDSISVNHAKIEAE